MLSVETYTPRSLRPCVSRHLPLVRPGCDCVQHRASALREDFETKYLREGPEELRDCEEIGLRGPSWG